MREVRERGEEKMGELEEEEEKMEELEEEGEKGKWWESGRGRTRNITTLKLYGLSHN